MPKRGNWKRQLFHRDKWLCQYCGIQVQGRDQYQTNAATVDHVIPLADGGMSIQSNMVTACKGCNLGKGDLSLAEWERRGKPRKEYKRRRDPEATAALQREGSYG